MNYIYSKAFMIKSQSLEIAKLCPDEISCLKIEIFSINLPDEKIGQIQNGHGKNLRSKRKIDPEIRYVAK